MHHHTFVTDALGWLSSIILLLTVANQVRKQWISEESSGISPWLFLGQMAASVGFVAYSWALQNWVFVCTNILMLLNAMVGYWVLRRNQKKEEFKHAGEGHTAAGS